MSKTELSPTQNALKYKTNPRTRSCYKSYWKKFEKLLGEKCDSWINKKKTDKEYEKDILDVLVKSQNLPPKSKQTMINAVKFLLIINDINLTDKFWKYQVKELTKGGPYTEDEAPTKPELRQILQKGNVKDIAFFLILATSGIRVGEALKIWESDVITTNKPTKVIIREEIAEKGGRRVTFITDEATHWLDKWKRLRNQYITSKMKKHNFRWGKIDEDDPRLFPFSYSVALQSWNRLTKATGFDQKDRRTNRRIYHIHSLRKFFRTELEPHLKNKIIHSLLGQISQLDSDYLRNRTARELEHAEKYLEIQDALTVLNPTIDDEKVNEIYEELEQREKTLTEKEKLWTNRLIEQDNKINSLEILMKRQFYDSIDPFSGPKLTSEQEKYEDDLEKEIILEKERKIKQSIKTDPRYKEYKIIFVDRTYNSDGSIRNYGNPFITKKKNSFDILSSMKSLEIAKEKMKQRPNKELEVKINELSKALIEFVENSMVTVSLEEMAYDKEEQLRDLKEKKMK